MTPAADSPIVMGILNVTPDSFSDGGLNLDPDAAVRRGCAMAAEGAAVIDVGGESTRPGAGTVGPIEEQRRVLPVIEALRDQESLEGTRISIDTRNEQTARAAIAAGADLINDVSASLWPVAAEAGVGWVAMHMAGDPRTMQDTPRYRDVTSEVRAFLEQRASAAEAAGVGEIWVDPGFGFGKTTAHNVALLANLDLLVADGRPVMVGTSRKRSLGTLLARSDGGLSPHPGPTGGTAEFDEVEPTPTGDRLEGSLATAVWAIIQGARIVRAHDICATAAIAGVLAGNPATG